VEATEFPHLSNKYSVMGVPCTVINETTFVEGAAPEALRMARCPWTSKDPIGVWLQIAHRRGESTSPVRV
jgi:hypothetical protein